MYSRKLMNKTRAFTLIELLVVIAIISILMAIVITNLTQAKGKSRDAKRVSDVAQLQLALEIFFDRCNRYPAVANNIPDISDSCTASPGTVKLSDFISQIPNPPTAGDYGYYVNGNPATDYTLRAKLESNSTVLSDDIDTSSPSFDCSDSPALYYCVVPR